MSPPRNGVDVGLQGLAQRAELDQFRREGRAHLEANGVGVRGERRGRQCDGSQCDDQCLCSIHGGSLDESRRDSRMVVGFPASAGRGAKGPTLSPPRGDGKRAAWPRAVRAGPLQGSGQQGRGRPAEPASPAFPSLRPELADRAVRAQSSADVRSGWPGSGPRPRPRPEPGPGRGRTVDAAAGALDRTRIRPRTGTRAARLEVVNGRLAPTFGRRQ